MDPSVDYYEVLGVPPTADRSEIKKAHRELVRKLHPDMGESGDPVLFQQVQSAFHILENDARRAEYDNARLLVSGQSTVEDMTTPGWGEETRATAPPPPTAPQSDTRGSWRPKKKQPYVPPHLRDEAFTAPPPEPDQPSPQETVTAVEEPETVTDSWTLRVHKDQQVHVKQSPRVMWSWPSACLVVSAVAALLAMGAAEGQGWVGKVLPAMFAVGYLVILLGVCATWRNARTGLTSAAGFAAALLVGVGLAGAGMYLGGGAGWKTGLAAVTAAASGCGFSYALLYRYVKAGVVSAGMLRKFDSFGKPATLAPNPQQKMVELHTAEALEQLTKIRSVRLFHACGTPASGKAEESFRTKYGGVVEPASVTDQVVISGHRVALVHSTIWAPGHYSMDRYGYLKRDGSPTGHEFNGLLSGLKAWRKALGRRVKVRSYLVVYSDGPVEVDVDSDIQVINAEELVNELGTFLVREQGVVDRVTANTVARCMLT